MDHEFWHSRWAENRIGFHLSDINPLLPTYWSALSPKREEPVFVPLCGKSLDLNWLATKHDNVVGVELSEIAVRAFFAENFFTPTVTTISGAMKLYQFDEISLYAGDFFTAPLDTYPLIYDRAALIAMPIDMRKQYVDRVKSVLAPGGRMLLVTLDYPQQEVEGPPFSVPEQEVRALFGEMKVTRLNRNEECDRTPKAKDVSYFAEEVWLIEA